MARKINLKYVSRDGSPLSEVDNIAAIARNPNTWMNRSETEECRRFSGTEDEAHALRERMEATVTSRFIQWENLQ